MSHSFRTPMSLRSKHPARVDASLAHRPSRRRLLTAGAVAVAAPLLVFSRRSAASMASSRTLAFRHTHTGESLSIAFAQGERYVAEALARVNWLLRDFRNGAVQPIDPQLLDQLHAVAQLTGSSAPFEVISGYRSPATNEALHRKSRGVATNSLHLEGRAIDVRLPDVPLADLRDAALSLKSGGVGFYAESRFVHLDTGRVRRW
jgi:uncharacterized protein YcbK (DUF882 family)